GLHETTAVVTGPDIGPAILVVVIIRFRAESSRLESDGNATLEIIAARAADRVDHTAGGTTELGRIAARLDLEFFEERKWRTREALPLVEIGDGQAVDEDRVLGDRRAAERDAAERGVSADHA